MFTNIKNIYSKISNAHWISFKKAFWEFVMFYLGTGIFMSLFTGYFKSKYGYLFAIVSIIGFLALITEIVLRLIDDRHHIYLKPMPKGKFVSNVLNKDILIFVLSITLPTIVFQLGTLSSAYHPKEIPQTNQGEINSIMSSNKISLIWMIIVSIFLAPIIEEYLYRYLVIGPKSFHGRKISPKHRLHCMYFAIFLFVWVHIYGQIFSMTWDYSEILILIKNIMSYTILSSILSYNFYRHGNIWNNICIHSAWNILADTLQLLMMA